MEPNQEMFQPSAPQGQYSPQQNFQAPPPDQPVYPTGSKLKHHINALLIPLIVLVLLLLSSLGFGIWAFMGRQEFKNNVDGIVKRETEKAVGISKAEQEKAFTEREKEPNKEYNGPAAFGSVKITYPKTWSAQVDEPNKGATPIDGYFHPDFVPARSSGTAFALRLEIVEEDYASVLKKFDAAVKQNKVKVSPITTDNVPGVIGSRIDGEIDRDIKGSVVLYPIRDKTLILRTESEIFVKDFNEIVLAKLKFDK